MGGFGGGEGLVCEGSAGLVDGALGRNAEVSKRLLSWMSLGPCDPSSGDDLPLRAGGPPY